MEGTWGEGWGGILAKAEYGRGSLLGGVRCGASGAMGLGASDSVAKKELAAHSGHSSGFETVQDKQHMGNIKLYTAPSNCFVFLYQVTATDREHFASQRLKISLALMCFRNI